jgi:hypothetical protein
MPAISPKGSTLEDGRVLVSVKIKVNGSEYTLTTTPYTINIGLIIKRI